MSRSDIAMALRRWIYNQVAALCAKSEGIKQ